MSDQRNLIKSKSKQLKKLLSEKEIEIKHTQSLEIMSKLLFNKPWHSFQKEDSINKEFLIKEDPTRFKKEVEDINSIIPLPEKYFDYLKEKCFKDKFVFGVDEDSKKMFLTDCSRNANTLVLGSSGSGKTNFLKFLLMSHIANNSKDTMYFLVDLAEGMNQFKFLDKDKYKNNIKRCIDNTNIESMDKFSKLIDFLYLELEERKKNFYNSGARNYIDYEEITKTKISRLVIAIENFFMIPDHSDMKFHINNIKKDHIAYKLKMIMRLGEKYGISFIISSHRPQTSDFPTDLKVGLSNILF